MVMPALPAVTFQEAIHEMLRVGIFSDFRGKQRHALWPGRAPQVHLRHGCRWRAQSEDGGGRLRHGGNEPPSIPRTLHATLLNCGFKPGSRLWERPKRF